MSYRDLRNFTEMMRALGYTRLISMENFRSPNFPLVAEILIWLANRFEVNAGVHSSCDSEEDRVLLIRSVAHFMALKANIILNTKRLYQADGYAIKELLKIVSLLYNAIRTVQNGKPEPKNNIIVNQDMADLSARIKDLKMSRELAAKVTSTGSSLHELLAKEVELREARSGSVSSQLELSAIEGAVAAATEATLARVAEIRALTENVSITEASLDAKIERRSADLDRHRKRLQTLKRVRPGFLEEFERLEVELQSLYKEYVTKTRLVAYLEMQQEEALAEHQDQILKKQNETRRLMEEMEEEDERKLMEEEAGAEEEEPVPTKQSPTQQPQQPRRLRTATALRGRIGTGKKRVFGSMNVQDDDSGSLDSDSDLLVDFDDDDDDDGGSDIASDRQLDHVDAASDDDF